MKCSVARKSAEVLLPLISFFLIRNRRKNKAADEMKGKKDMLVGIGALLVVIILYYCFGLVLWCLCPDMELLLELTSGLVAWVQQLVYQLVELVKAPQAREPMPLGGGLEKVPPADGYIMGMSAPLPMNNSGNGEGQNNRAQGPTEFSISSMDAGGIDELCWGDLPDLFPVPGPEVCSMPTEGGRALPASADPVLPQGPTPAAAEAGCSNAPIDLTEGPPQLNNTGIIEIDEDSPASPEIPFIYISSEEELTEPAAGPADPSPEEIVVETSGPSAKKQKKFDLEEGALRLKEAQESREWAAFLKEAQTRPGGEQAALRGLEKDLANTSFYSTMLTDLKSKAALLNKSPYVRHEEEWKRWINYIKAECLSQGRDYSLENVWRLCRNIRRDKP